MPLYCDREGKQPNVTGGLLDTLGAQYGETPTPEDLAAYVYALLGGQSYTRCFWKELETPGPRVPITKDSEVFSKAAALGRHLIWLHTYAERFRGDDRGDKIPAGRARCTAPVSDDPERYPENFTWIDDRTGDSRGRRPFRTRRVCGVEFRGLRPQGCSILARIPDETAGR